MFFNVLSTRLELPTRYVDKYNDLIKVSHETVYNSVSHETVYNSVSHETVYNSVSHETYKELL